MPSARSRVALLVLLAVAGGACHDEGDITIASLDFNGVEQVDKGALADALHTRRGSRLPWGRKRSFDRQAFEADLKRLEAFYRDRGFPDARVRSFDVRLNDAQDEVAIVVSISEGEPVLVAAIELTGFEVLPEGDRQALTDALPLRAGRPLDHQVAVAARERALNELHDHGYPYAAVTVTDRETSPGRRRVTFEAVPGTRAQFGPIEIDGQVSVTEHVIRRQLTFQPGDLFTRREMRESQRKLYGLELFEFANVVSREETMSQAPTVPVRVTVAEGKHRKVTLGAGYGTEEQGRARIRWDHVNFLGGARHAGVEGKWSSLDRGVRADYREPFFLAPHYSLDFDGQAWQAAEPVYALDSLGGRATLRHQANTRTFWTVSVIGEYQRSRIASEALLDFTVRDELIALGLDPRTGETSGTLSAVAFDVGRTTATNLLDARSGYVLNAHVEQAGRWLGGSFDYWSASGEARHYASAGRTLVLANRLRLGAIGSLRGTGQSVPFYKRYFLGGSSSIRGWGRFEVGPTSGSGFPIGGHTMLEGSSEVRAPLWGRLGAVAFIDYGNVWSQAWDFKPGDLRYAVGPGLRYLTPIGPARVDVGYQLNPIENLLINGAPQRRPWRLHFSVGQAF